VINEKELMVVGGPGIEWKLGKFKNESVR